MKSVVGAEVTGIEGVPIFATTTVFVFCALIHAICLLFTRQVGERCHTYYAASSCGSLISPTSLLRRLRVVDYIVRVSIINESLLG